MALNWRLNAGELRAMGGSLLRRLRTRWSSRQRTAKSLFLDDQAFRFEFACERMRVDRNRSPLAVLMIDLPVDSQSAADVEFLGRILRQRLRITDTIGLLADGRVGVLLPDTPESGAWKVADDVCSEYPVGKRRPSCEVFLYPTEETRRRDGRAVREGQAVSSGAGATPELLFFSPTPRWKRAIDVTIALTGLVASAPLLAVIAVAVKATSRGPVLYVQEREGLGGRRFRMFKFRTMHVNAEHHQAALRVRSVQDGPAFKMHRDPRTTWVGRWLRKTSLDELPQLWNVLRGEMSLVGPRPLPTAESQECLPWQRQRLAVVPGMTGLWQVHGRNTVSFDEWMRMDLQYVRRRSPWYDALLLLRTAPALVFSRGPR